MKKSIQSLFAAAVVLAACSFSFAADQIDNPQYKQWSKFKSGTSVTMKTDSDMAGNKTAMETTTTLTDISAEKATVETKMSMTMAGGQKMDMPAQKRDVLAKMDKPADAPATTKPDIKESEEDVDVNGKKIHCKVTEMTNTANGMTTHSKTWTSDEVPGSMVKMESTMDGAMKGTTKMMISAMDVK